MAGKGSSAQVAARERNWYIARLRGLWHNVAFVQDQEIKSEIRSSVERELVRLGVQGEGHRDAIRRDCWRQDLPLPKGLEPNFNFRKTR